MRVDVIRSRLRVVFEDEHDCVAPVGTVRECIDDSAERQVIVGHVRSRRMVLRSAAGRMVGREVEDFERRHVPVFDEAL